MHTPCMHGFGSQSAIHQIRFVKKTSVIGQPKTKKGKKKYDINNLQNPWNKGNKRDITRQ